MELNQSERDSRVGGMLDEIDDVETRIEDLYSMGRPRTLILYLLLLLVPIAAVLAALFVPSARSLTPFLIVACAYAIFGLRWIGAKNEQLAQLKEERTRLIEERTA